MKVSADIPGPYTVKLSECIMVVLSPDASKDVFCQIDDRLALNVELSPNNEP